MPARCPLPAAAWLVSLSALCAPAAAAPAFIRGDAGGDGRVGIGDAVLVLRHLFAGGPAPSCLDAADADDNARLEASDAIYLLSYLFAGGARPRRPFPACGADPPAGGTLGYRW